MTVRFSFEISYAVAAVLQLDDAECRKGCIGEGSFTRKGGKSATRGWLARGTREELTQLAGCMTRSSDWDLSPAIIRACNRSAKKLRAFVAAIPAGSVP